MLILTRRVGETVVIGENITVTILAVNGSQVRIGIKAPKEITVDREEIAERKKHDRFPNINPVVRDREKPNVS